LAGNGEDKLKSQPRRRRSSMRRRFHTVWMIYALWGKKKSRCHFGGMPFQPGGAR